MSFPTDQHWAVGNAATVSLPDRYLLKGALLVYGLPLAALLAGAALGSAFGRSDLGAALGALGALVGAGAAVLPLRRRLERATLAHLVLRPTSEAP
jgi:sigma-E factor negative regulatory protein RseC